MSRNLKLNFKQYTVGHIKRRCQRMELDVEENGEPPEDPLPLVPLPKPEEYEAGRLYDNSGRVVKEVVA